jgi:hypothetical protein
MGETPQLLHLVEGGWRLLTLGEEERRSRERALMEPGERARGWEMEGGRGSGEVALVGGWGGDEVAADAVQLPSCSRAAATASCMCSVASPGCFRAASKTALALASVACCCVLLLEARKTRSSPSKVLASRRLRPRTASIILASG